MASARMSTRSRPLKVAVIGDKHVGKTSLIRRYVHDSYSPHYTYTQGGDMERIDVNISDVNVRVTLVDAAGHDYARSLIKPLYRDVQAILVVFDLTKDTTLKSVPEWLQQIEVVNPSSPAIFLVGNKQDVTSHRSVHYEEAEFESQRYELPYYETSAKTGYNVQETFIDALRAAWQKVLPIYVPLENIILSTREHQTQTKSWCSTS